METNPNFYQDGVATMIEKVAAATDEKMLRPLVGPPIEATVDAVIRWHVERVLGSLHGNKTATAKALGVDRKTLHRWLGQWRT